MPSITGLIVDRRPVIIAVFHVSRPRFAAILKAGQEPPAPFAGRALIDTGATDSCIDPAVTAKLGIEPRGTALVHTPSTGDDPHSVTLVDLSIFLIPTEKSAPLDLPSISAMEVELLPSQGIHALIGQDVLARCVLEHDGPRQRFTLSWEG